MSPLPPFFVDVLAFFTFGTWGFWLLALILSIVYTTAVESDKHEFAIFCTMIAILVGWSNILILFASWKLLLICLVAYGIIGGAWSVFRWFRYCKEFVAAKKFESASDYDRTFWVNGDQRTLTKEEFYAYKLQPSKNKSRLIGWIVYWPWSMIWNICGDFVTGIYDMLSNVYTRISEAAIKRALKNDK